MEKREDLPMKGVFSVWYVMKYPVALNKKRPLDRVIQRPIGGGEGNRTPVREHSAQQPYVCSR